MGPREPGTRDSKGGGGVPWAAHSTAQQGARQRRVVEQLILQRLHELGARDDERNCMLSSDGRVRKQRITIILSK